MYRNLKATLDYADNPDKTTAPEYLDEDLYAALRYAENDDKTDCKMFVGGINCSAQNAYAEMIAVQRRFGLRGKVVGYHGIQSFREGEVTPEQAFEIGKATARRMWGDKYQVLVTVHLNTDNIHCHFVVNPVSFKDGSKFQNKIGDHKELRKVSDQICREHGLSVLENSKFYSKSKKKEYWVHKAGKRTHRDMLRQDVDEALAKCGSYNVASSAPFRRIAYRDAMETYGSDKPDLRIDLTCKNVTSLFTESEFEALRGQTVKMVPVSDCKLTRKQIDKLLGDCEVQSGSKAYWFKMDENGQLAGGIAKFVTGIQEQLTQALDLKPNTLVLVAAGAAATKSVGVLIKTFGVACEGHMDKERYEFCWIVDFPMYEIGDESGQLEFCHNPFSMPSGGLEVLLKAERGEIDPLTITADQYDLVCNGVELSSGAVRNHDPEIMVKAFELVRLGEEDVKKKFPAMYNAFCYGAPPHAGIAPGVDRMVMLLAGESSIREIIPFPMNKNAQDIMMGAPSTVEQKQLDELHIALIGDVEEN